MNMEKSPDSMFGLDKLKPVIASEEVIATQAGMATMLSGQSDDAVNNFKDAQAKLKEGDFSPVDEVRQQYSENELREASKVYTDALVAYANDPNKQRELTTQFATTFYSKDGKPKTRDIKVIAFLEQYRAGTEVGGAENADAQANIMTGPATLETVSREIEQKQQAVNIAKMSVEDEGQGLMSKLFDAAGAIFGVGEGFAYNRLFKTAREKITGESTGFGEQVMNVIFAGNTRLRLREMIASLPREQQSEAIGQVAALAKEVGMGIFPGSDNTLRRLAAVDNLAGGATYTDDDRLEDAISVLDAVGIGQGAKLIGSFGARANKIAAAKRQATQRPDEGTSPDVIPAEAINVVDEAPQTLEYAGATRAYELEITKRDALRSKLAGLEEQLANATGKDASRVKTEIKKTESELASFKEPEPVQELYVYKEPKLTPEDLAFKRTAVNAAITSIEPNSPLFVTKVANMDRAEDMKNLMVTSLDPELVMALTGKKNINEALFDTVRPQITDATGRVTVGIADDAGRIVPRNVKTAEQGETIIPRIIGFDNFSEKEKLSALANIRTKFSSTRDTTLYQNMSTFRLDGTRVEVSALYGSSGGAFPNPAAAKAQMQLSLRDYGIDESDLVLMVREGTEYRPISWADAGMQEGNYLVKVKTARQITPADVTEWDLTDSKLNFFDAAPMGQGNRGSTLTRYFFDTSAVIDPILHKGLSAAIDGASEVERRMNALAATFADPLRKLPQARINKVTEYFKEANRMGIPFNHADLVIRGFTEAEIDIVRNWRQFWDMTYEVENSILINTLRGEGYKLFKSGGDSLFVKELGNPNRALKAYNPHTGGFDNLVPEQLNQLYEQGGTIARPRVKMRDGKEQVEYVVLNSENKNATRGITDNDRVLAYREGYFTIRYKAPKFVEEVVTDANGKQLYTRAVAVAGDTKTAEAHAGKLNYQAGGMKYRVRDSVEEMRLADEDWWELNDVGGRLTHRRRGEQLDEAHDSMVELDGTSFVQSPADSAIIAAKSSASAIAMRPAIEAAKARFMNQFGYLVKDGVTFPRNEGDLIKTVSLNASDLKDARTNMEFINYMEAGYINRLDSGWKQMLNGIGNAFGKKGLSKLERGAKSVADVGPTKAAKTAAFITYIASNPVRQIIIQPAQSLRMLAYNPQGSTFAAEYFIRNSAGKLTGDTANLHKMLVESGLISSITKSNLVRESLLDLTDGGSTIAGKVLDKTRKVGFDVGERINLQNHGAFVYDKMKRQGWDMYSLEAMSELRSRVRNLTYNMNKAGDFPYTQNSAGMFLQFMQIPHKAIMQALNRNLTRKEKVALIGFDTVLWGAPTAFLANLGWDALTGDPEVDENIREGLVSMMINGVLRAHQQDEIDFSSLNPYGLDGWFKLATAMYEENATEVFLNSPIGGIFRDGGRVMNAFRSTVGAFTLDVEGIDTADKARAVLREYAKIFSGVNNTFEAYDMWKIKKVLTAKGVNIDDDPTLSAVFAKLAGFSTKDIVKMYETNQAVSKKVKGWEDEIKGTVDNTLRFMHSMTSDSTQNLDAIRTAGALVFDRYKDDYEARKIVAQQLKWHMQNEPQKMSKMMVQLAKIPTIDDATFNSLISSSHLDEETKQNLMEAREVFQGK